MRILNSIIGVISATTFVSCVSSSKYKALEDKYNQEMEARRQEEQKGRTLNEQLKKTQSDREMETNKLKSDLNKTEAEKQAEMAKERALREELQKRQAELESRDNQLNSLTDKLKAMTDAGKLKVRIVGGRLVLDLPSDVLFTSGSAKLSKAGRETVMQLGKSLSDIKDQRFQIEGYTDNAKIKTAAFPSNWDLAAARAMSVLKIMLDSGVDMNRVSAASYGETNPVASNDSPDGRTLNRRIEIVVVPDLSIIAPAAAPVDEPAPAATAVP